MVKVFLFLLLAVSFSASAESIAQCQLIFAEVANENIEHFERAKTRVYSQGKKEVVEACERYAEFQKNREKYRFMVLKEFRAEIL